MKKLIVLLSVFVSKSCLGQTLTAKQLREDFQIFKNSIEEIHPGLYWYADTAEVSTRFESLEAKLVEEMNLKDYYGLLQRFYAGIRCGHSWMSMPYTWRKPLDEGPYRIPLNFYVESDRMVVYRDLTNDQYIREGQEVVSINGIKTRELIDTLIQYTPTDGYARTRQIRILASNFSRYYQVHYGMDSIFNVVLDLEGNQENYSLIGISDEEANKRSIDRYGKVEHAKQALEYKKLATKVGYIRINSFDKESIKSDKQKYKPFLKKTFEEIRHSGINKLIIDLRGNGGGEDHYGATLAKYLFKEPFDYYLRMEAITKKFRHNEYSYQKGFNTLSKILKKDKNKQGTYTFNFSRQIKKQKPVKSPFTGKVIVLIDGGTFSAATEVASILHSNQRATFIGDETGGGYYGNNSAMMYGIQLPNSKINYYLPVIRYYLAVDHAPFIGRGLIPDISLPQTYEDYMTPNDEVLDLAVKEIKK